VIRHFRCDDDVTSAEPTEILDLADAFRQKALLTWLLRHARAES
jgi:hypothetical protein